MIDGETPLATADEVPVRPLLLDIHDVIDDALVARSWARRGIRLALAQDETMFTEAAQLDALRATTDKAMTHWNAMTLVAIYGGLEDLIESIGRGIRTPTIQTNPDKRRRMFENNRLRIGEARAQGNMTPEKAQILTELQADLVKVFLPSPLESPNPTLSIADGWEDFLGRVHLGPLPDRPLPDELRETLNEFAQIRNVILHRMGRIDRKALDQVKQGPWSEVDEVVIIDDDLYKVYVAALMSYWRGLTDRINQYIFGLPAIFDLTGWRDAVPVI